MLPADELAAMQAEALLALPQTCVIKRKTRQSDGAGGSTLMLTTVTTVYGRAGAVRADLLEAYADRIGKRTAALIVLPAVTDVQTDDQITLGSQTWEVIGVEGGETWEIARRAVCARLE